MFGGCVTSKDDQTVILSRTVGSLLLTVALPIANRPFLPLLELLEPPKRPTSGLLQDITEVLVQVFLICDLISVRCGFTEMLSINIIIRSNQVIVITSSKVISRGYYQILSDIDYRVILCYIMLDLVMWLLYFGNNGQGDRERRESSRNVSPLDSVLWLTDLGWHFGYWYFSSSHDLLARYFGPSLNMTRPQHPKALQYHCFLGTRSNNSYGRVCY